VTFRADRCRSCKAEIRWVRSATSTKLLPLDLRPEKRVVLEQVPVGDEVEQRARVVDVYTSHFATCPAAAEWKGRHR